MRALLAIWIVISAALAAHMIVVIRAVDTLECIDRFESEYGMTWESSTLDIVPVIPVALSWDSGDRRTSCSVAAFSDEQLSGPAHSVVASVPGEDLRIEDATTCSALADASAATIQGLIVGLDSLTLEQQSDLSLGVVPEGLYRTVKREGLLFLMMTELRCAPDNLDALLIEQLDEIETTTQQGQDIVDSIRVWGYWTDAEV